MGRSKRKREKASSNKGIYPVTNWISPTEPCFSLAEVDINVESRGWKRCRIMYVIRGDRFSEYWEIMGPSLDYKIDQFRIPGGFLTKNNKIRIVHSVDELREIADSFHHEPEEIETEPQDLAGMAYRQAEIKQWLRKGKRVYGKSN